MLHTSRLATESTAQPDRITKTCSQFVCRFGYSFLFVICAWFVVTAVFFFFCCSLLWSVYKSCCYLRACLCVCCIWILVMHIFSKCCAFYPSIVALTGISPYVYSRHFVLLQRNKNKFIGFLFASSLRTIAFAKQLKVPSAYRKKLSAKLNFSAKVIKVLPAKIKANPSSKPD